MGFNTVPFNPFPPSSDQKGSGGGSYVLPIAADDTLGGVKVGDNLTIEEDGTLNAEDPYVPPVYSETPQRLGDWATGIGLYRVVKEYSTPLSIPYDTWVDTGVDLTDKTFITAFPIKGVIPVVEMAVGAGGFTNKLAINNQVNSSRTIGGIIVYYTESEV